MTADTGPVSELVTVTVTNAVRTSAGPGPGTKQLPPRESADLVGRKVAVYGERPKLGTEQATEAMSRHYGQEQPAWPAGAPGHWVPSPSGDGSWDPPWSPDPEEAG